MFAGTKADLGEAYLRFTIGEKIKSLRIASGLSLQELATNVGSSQHAIAAYEAGRAGLSVEILLRIAKHLSFCPADFLTSFRAEPAKLREFEPA